jgi:hypothetical protein
VTTEQLIRRSTAHVKYRDLLFLLDRVAERHRLLCPRCGFDVVAGDRLGQRPGFRALQETQAGDERDAQSNAAARRTDVALSKVADAGVSRLSLAAVDRIFGLVTR